MVLYLQNKKRIIIITSYGTYTKKMAIPSLYDITLPLMKFLSDEKQHKIPEIVDYLTNHFQLTEEEKNKLKPSGDRTVFRNRIDWARFELKKAGLMSVSPEKIHEITSDGIEILKKNPEKIDRKFLLLQVPKYAEYFKALKERSDEKGEISISENENRSPEDMMMTGYNEYRKNFESEILERIMNNSFNFFEHLVIDLIAKMGYGRGKVTGRTGDGGIDGIIDEDKLGLSQIFLQAKRWKGTVGSKELRDFAGMLDSKKSKKGIFITTSHFSDEAREFAPTTSSKIVLINGKRLAELMFEHNVGFSPGDNYQLKNIDEDYFS